MADDISSILRELQAELPSWPGDRSPDSFGPEDKQRFRLEIAVPPGPVSKQDVLALRRVYRQLQEIPLAAAIHQVCEERRIVVGSACRAKADWLRQLFQRRGVAVSIVPDDNAA